MVKNGCAEFILPSNLPSVSDSELPICVDLGKGTPKIGAIFKHWGRWREGKTGWELDGTAKLGMGMGWTNSSKKRRRAHRINQNSPKKPAGQAKRV
jgi:hypothetical protein